MAAASYHPPRASPTPSIALSPSPTSRPPGSTHLSPSTWPARIVAVDQCLADGGITRVRPKGYHSADPGRVGRETRRIDTDLGVTATLGSSKARIFAFYRSPVSCWHRRIRPEMRLDTLLPTSPRMVRVGPGHGNVRFGPPPSWYPGGYVQCGGVPEVRSGGLGGMWAARGAGARPRPSQRALPVQDRETCHPA